MSIIKSSTLRTVSARASRLYHTSLRQSTTTCNAKRHIMTTSTFPEPYTVQPHATHKHTIIALHGLGSAGSDFANSLLYAPRSKISNESSALTDLKFANWTERLPVSSIKFIFPSAPTRRITFPMERETPAWFALSSIFDLEFEQENQQPGLRESVCHLGEIVEKEIEVLKQNGRSSRDLFVLGRSQGSSVVGWTLMTGRLAGIGGVVLGGSWLIHRRALLEVIRERDGQQQAVSDHDEVPEQALDFVRSMFEVGAGRHDDKKAMPVLMGHSIDDKWISIDMGRQFRDVLQRAGFQPDWREYKGADEQGHWFKEPEELDALAEFILNGIDGS